MKNKEMQRMEMKDKMMKNKMVKNKKMKNKRIKLFVCFMTALLLSAMLTGCGTSPAPADTADNEKIKIDCTIFPQYDWVRQILGERIGQFEVTLLLQNQMDIHNYQPTVDDIVTIAGCDLFIYTGGESDQWVADALKEATNQEMVTINLLEEMGDAAKLEEIIDGMEEEEEETTEAGNGSHDEEAEAEYDEHVWLSLKNARTLCTAITGVIAQMDAANAGVYESNLAAYTEKIAVLDEDYQAAAAVASVRTLVFGDRFPFRYLLDDYGLDCFAAFPGCSAETEASFETIVFLAEKVDELQLKTIMVTESADQSIANTISTSSAAGGQTILVLDSMQSVTAADITAGSTYLGIMADNLQVLKAALDN